ncbi:MAG TPA: TonB-dependent receptor [Bacteroidia bacterium]
MLPGSALFAQDTTAHLLNEAIIIQNRYEQKRTGFKESKPDSLVKQQFNGFSLADLLSFNSSFFVKSYGGNGIATTSIRGGNAAQSTVNWNGFTINSPMLGQSDLSILPGFFYDDVSTVYGGNAGIGGSGSVGGTVYLKNAARFSENTKINAFTNYSSANVIRSGAGFKSSTDKFINITRVYINSGKNNFLFGDTINGIYETRRIAHNKLIQYGLLQENIFKLTKNQKLGLHAWLQSSDKQIPLADPEKKSEASQYDASIRASADWQLTKEKLSLFARTAFFVEQLNYTDSSVALFSKSRSLSSITEMESVYRFNSLHSVDAGINQTYIRAYTKSYGGDPYQLRYAAFASWKFENRKKWFSSVVNARQEMVVNGQTPFIWNVGIAVKPFTFLTVHGNVGRIFRLPTLNDLYWNPGGNPNLKPEVGYTQELGIEVKKRMDAWDLFFDVTCFNRNVTNWIAWLPSGAGVWSPVNILEVWSRGCETQTSLSYSYKKFRIKNKLMTNYIVSTYEKAVNENDESVGRQLIYTPMYSGSDMTIISYADLSFMYNATYTGYRYMSSDNYKYLPPFFLHAASINYQLKMKKCKTDFFLSVENLMNKSYQVVGSNPMPLRYFRLGVNFEFSK